ncbi:phosphate ABC transporter substrate-binding protein [Tuberibacillus sp. Marseille-P3662]|uniref:phosphate ABC transporter substrate-binding protein n=1 Tax=Tuberibacillus sp. Marseille-P3662 TaxID=1965358 RepID=UPI000A1CDD68
MKIRNGMLFMVLAAVIVFASACGNGGKSGNTDGTSEAGNTKGSNEKLSGKLIVGGSSALQPLAAAAAKQFMQEKPSIKIQVQGGGSGTGLSEVASGNFDIGNSDIFAEAKSGIDPTKLTDHKVAVVGMTAAVNPKAGVNNLSQEELIKVFTGEVTNWSQVGGNDVDITLVNRPDGSGTRATFVKFALNGQTPAKGITQDSSNTVKRIVAETPGGIGYESFSYFSEEDSIVKLSIDGVEATAENVQSGKFPVWAYEHMYTKGEPNKNEQAFLDYMMSETVQGKLVPAQGYISATKMQVKRNAKGETTKK